MGTDNQSAPILLAAPPSRPLAASKPGSPGCLMVGLGGTVITGIYHAGPNCRARLGEPTLIIHPAGRETLFGERRQGRKGGEFGTELDKLVLDDKLGSLCLSKEPGHSNSDLNPSSSMIV